MANSADPVCKGRAYLGPVGQGLIGPITLLFHHKIICCGYSSEVHYLGHSSEYTQNVCFYTELEKVIPELSSNNLPLQVLRYSANFDD